MAIQTWNPLSYFDSFDLIQRVYNRIHNKTLNSERTSEVVYAFAQGRDYFYAADSASDTVSPLLLYYSLLSICRALIMLLDHRAESTLQPSHGLEAIDWRNTLYNTGDVLELSVEVRTGTFSELEKATGNSVLMAIPGEPTGMLVPSSQAFGRSVDQRILFRDVIAREPSLTKLYENITEKSACLCPGGIFARNGLFEIRFENAFTNISGLDELRELFHFGSDLKIVKSTTDARNPFPHYGFVMPGNDICKLPTYEERGPNEGYLIAPTPTGGQWSPLLRCFLQAYFLGMLARYHPSHWMRMVYGRKGDAMFPLLKRTLQHLKEEFPRAAQTVLQPQRL